MMKIFSMLCFCFLVSRHHYHRIDAKNIVLADYPEIKDHLDEFLSIEQDLADELNEKSERLEELESRKRMAINSKIHFKNIIVKEFYFTQNQHMCHHVCFFRNKVIQ